MLGRRRARAGIDELSVAWSREKLLAVLGTSAFFALLLLAGFVLAVISWIRPGDDANSATGQNGGQAGQAGQNGGQSGQAGQDTGGSYGTGTGAGSPGTPMATPTDAAGQPSGTLTPEDQLAARPMLAAPLGAFTPAPLTSRVAPDPISMPSGTKADRLGVVTGFPRTPQGALCLLYTSPSPRDQRGSRMPSSA